MDSKKTTEFDLPEMLIKYPKLKERLTKALEGSTVEEREMTLKQFGKFLSGDMTWAEFKGFPKKLLKELATMGYQCFKIGDYQKAETIFKGLSVIDHNNWYYRTSLGAIYQKQKMFEEAIDEYDTALYLNEKELTALVNRGECLLHLGDVDEAIEDFDKAICLDPQLSNKWVKRAKALRDKMNQARS